MSDNGPTLERLEKLEIRLYKLKTESHLAIGAGEASGDLRPVDKPIIRALICDPDGGPETRFPYLPASSLHGVWRAWVEKALRSQTQLDDFPDLAKCLTELREKKKELAPILERFMRKDYDIAGDSESAEENARKLLEDLKNRKCIYPNVCNPFWDHDKCETLSDPREGQSDLPKAKTAWKEIAGLDRGPCKVCSIFGHPGQRGRVRFTHAHTKVAKPQDFPVDIITRVAINRITGAADSGKLFDIEAVPPGVVFYFFVILENMSEEQVKNFEFGYRALNLNLANLGAHGTVGFGMVSITKERSWFFGKSIFDFDPDIIDDLAKDGYEPPKQYPSNRFPKFLNLLALRKKGAWLTQLEAYKYTEPATTEPAAEVKSV